MLHTYRCWLPKRSGAFTGTALLTCTLVFGGFITFLFHKDHANVNPAFIDSAKLHVDPQDLQKGKLEYVQCLDSDDKAGAKLKNNTKSKCSLSIGGLTC